jgi:hypothetical protein
VRWSGVRMRACVRLTVLWPCDSRGRVGEDLHVDAVASVFAREVRLVVGDAVDRNEAAGEDRVGKPGGPFTSGAEVVGQAASRPTASRTYRRARAVGDAEPDGEAGVGIAACAGGRAPAAHGDRRAVLATAFDVAPARSGPDRPGGRGCGRTAESRQGGTARRGSRSGHRISVGCRLTGSLAHPLPTAQPAR